MPILPLSLDTGMRQLAAQLSGQRVIAFNVNLARICGDVKAALFASQLLYWSRVGKDLHTNGGWIFKTRQQWQDETGLTRFEQESARKRLQGLGLVEQARVGAPPANCYKVALPQLGQRLAKLLNQPPPGQQQWSLFALRSSEAHIRQLLGRSMAYYTVFAKITDSIPAAVLLTKVLALHGVVAQSAKGQKNAEWFSLSAQQWQDETGLRAAQLRLAKQELCQLSILEEAQQTYPLRRTYHRVNITTINNLLAQQLTSSQSSLLGRIVALARAQEEDATTGLTTPSPTLGGGGQKLPSVTLVNSVKNFDSTSRGYSVKNFYTNHPTSQAGPVWAGSTTKTQVSPKSTSYPLRVNQESGLQHGSRLVLARQTAGFSSTRGYFEHETRPVLAPLHARAVKGITNSITTTTPATRPVVVGLVWPSGMREMQGKATILLKAVPKHDWQPLLDEMAGQMADGKVKLPLAYLRKLISLHLAGTLVLERADEVALARARQAAAALRLEQAMNGSPAVTPVPAIPAGRPSSSSTPLSAQAQLARDKARALVAQMKSEPNKKFPSTDSSTPLHP